MSRQGKYYDHIWLNVTLLNKVGGSTVNELRGASAACLLSCYFFNYFGFPATIYGKASIPQRKTGLVFRNTGNSETTFEVKALQPGDFEDLHEGLAVQQPKAGTERIAVVVESYEDKSTGARHQPSDKGPISLNLSIKP